MKMIQRYFAIFFTFFYFSILNAAQGIEGNWTTIDDKTGVKRALVNLSVQDGKMRGRIIKVYKQKRDTGICMKCPGDFKDKPIEGLTFLWDLKEKSNTAWGDGRILDPKTGKIYRAKLTLKGDKLYVRGYVGTSILGRTQIWVRES